MKFALTLLACLVGTALCWNDGIRGGQCGRMHAGSTPNEDSPHPEQPEQFEPQHQYIIDDAGPDDNIQRITFRQRPQDGNMIGYSFQIRDFADLSNNTRPRGFLTLTNLTYDRLQPCQGNDFEPHSNTITHANASKIQEDIANGLGGHNDVTFVWDDQLPGGIQDTPDCAKVVGTIMGDDGLWWHQIASDCFLNCNVIGCTDSTNAETIFI